MARIKISDILQNFTLSIKIIVKTSAMQKPLNKKFVKRLLFLDGLSKTAYVFNLARSLLVYGNANMYRPENNCRNNGGSGAYVIHGGGSAGLMALATKLANTVNVKTMDSQR